MLRKSISVSVVLLLVSPMLLWAADVSHFDLVPENALLGVTIRSPEQLGKKGDALVEKTGWKAPDRPSKMFQQVVDFLGIRAGLDFDGPGGVVLANPKECGVKEPFEGQGTEKLIVAIVTFKDRDEMGGNFGLKKGELKPETITKIKPAGLLGGGNMEWLAYTRGNQLLMGMDEKAILSVAKGKPSSNLLTAQQKRSLGDADLFFFIGARAWGKQWDDVTEQTKKLLPDAEHGGDAELNKEVLESAASLQHLFGGLRLHDDGASFRVVTLLDKKNASAQKLLASVNSGEGTSDLAGLPVGRVIAAEALRGDGSKNVALVRTLLYSLMTLPGNGASELISAADRTTYLGVFAEVWKLLKGNRLAVYQNEDEEKKGLFSVIAILDMGDPEKMLKEIRQLMRLGDGKDLKLSGAADKDDVVRIQKLVQDLGDDDFEVRAAAMTRLKLVGQGALPFLEKALDSSDPEVRHRADEIKKSIVASFEQRRKEALSNTARKPVRPIFTFIPAAQTLDGKPVHIVQIKFAESDPETVKRMQVLFGPDWDKLRLVIHEKQAVVLLGSDEKLLQTALTNVKEKRPGLAKTKDQETFAAHSPPGRKAELHLSLHTAKALLEAADLKDPPKTPAQPALTSLGLSVDGSSLELHAWLPAEELKVLLNAGATQQP